MTGQHREGGDEVDEDERSVLLANLLREESGGQSFDLESHNFGAELPLWLSLMWPVLLTNVGKTGMGLTDTIVLGHLNATSRGHHDPSTFLAAASYSTIWTSLSSCITWQGTAAAVTVLCSSAVGARKKSLQEGDLEQAQKDGRLVGAWLKIGLLFTSIACIFIGLLWFFAGTCMQWLEGKTTSGNYHVDDEMRDLINIYCRILLIGFPAQAWTSCLNNFFLSQGVRLPQLWMNICFLGINLGLNMVLVYGIPLGGGSTLGGLGFHGSPIATTLSSWGLFFSMLAYASCNSEMQRNFWPEGGLLSSTAVTSKRCSEYLGQALPLAFSGALEEWQIQVVSVFSGKLGTTQAATHNAIMTVLWFLSSFEWACTAATRIRIAKFIGEGSAHAAKVVLSVATTFSIAVGLVVAAIFGFGRTWVGQVISNVPAVIHGVEGIAILVGGAYAGLAIFYVAMATLSAQGRSTAVAVSFFIGAWCVCVPLAWVLGFEIHPFSDNNGLLGLWIAMAVGYLITTLMSLYFVCVSDWEQVLEDARKRNEKGNGVAEDKAEKGYGATD